MDHRRWLLALILLVSLDFAVPFEAVPGGFVIDDDEEEAVGVERRIVERPTAAVRRPAPLRTAAAGLVPAVRRFVARPVLTPPRAFVPAAAQSADPASATDDH